MAAKTTITLSVKWPKIEMQWLGKETEIVLKRPNGISEVQDNQTSGGSVETTTE